VTWRRTLAAFALAAGCAAPGAREQPPLEMHVAACDDFDIDGTGRSPAWESVSWTSLNRREPEGLDYPARVRMLYSATGLYLLLDAGDRRLTATHTEDFADLWTEDVFEVFIWPDERFPIYFEYEISPLGAHLPLLVPNFDGELHGWRPWRDEPRRRIRKAVSVSGGPQRPGASITGWRAEVFVPYDLLKPLQNVPPTPGTRWRANFYRIDYDRASSTSWDWARVGPSFHEFQKFGTLVFQAR